ncbi:restriction endonuclease [bacterium]|nr:restriction endonuclease [bacterium]
MNYDKFCSILNRHIFEGEKKELLRRLAESPERFIGLFRPTKPKGKILQYLLQSHEIRMGDALEEIIGEILKDMGFSLLPKSIKVEENDEELQLDHYFTDGKTFYFIEQKVRDDHDSSKKRGQMENFEKKLKILIKQHSCLMGIMFFIDPDLTKNKNYYLAELKKLKEIYRIELQLFYGKELFQFLGYPDVWDDLLQWLKHWKEELPLLPEIDLDLTPEESFTEIKDLEPRIWRKLLTNNELWEEGIMNVLSSKGIVFNKLLDFFSSKPSAPYQDLKRILSNQIRKFYR